MVKIFNGIICILFLFGLSAVFADDKFSEPGLPSGLKDNSKTEEPGLPAGLSLTEEPVMPDGLLSPEMAVEKEQ